jgi:hypothetical protein
MDLSKMVLIYVCIAIGCIFWQPTLVLGDSKQAETVLNLFNIDMTNYQTLNNFNHSSSASSEGFLSKGVPNQGATIILTIIDGLFNVIGYLTLIFRAVFSPVIILFAGGFPVEIIYIIGVPVVVLFIISLVREVRGY